MKNVWKRTLLLIAAAAMLIALVSCVGSGKSGSTGTTGLGDTAQETDDGGCKHEWDEGALIAAPSYTATGTMLYRCLICGKPKTEIVPKLDPNACQHTWDSGKVTAEPTCGTTGTKLYTCTTCKYTKTESIPITGQHNYTFKYLVVEPTATSTGKNEGICAKCGQHVQTNDTTTYAAYQTKITNCQNKINGYSASQFGASKHSTMSSSDTPTYNPKSNEHPRILFNKSTLSAVRAAVNDPANAEKLKSLINTANDYTSGVPSGNTQGYEGEDYKEEILQTIRSKAFLYQMTGVRLYGYDAIRMMKEFLTNFKIADTSDPCRRYGEIMFTTAQVYDWCYNLLSSADREQFIIGVEKKCGPGMEVKFPPSAQGAISGHGCERQILRDYLAIAIAIYDEDPSWYKYVAGRVYTEFVPVRNYFYEAGYVPQGISTYLPIRFGSDLWSAWLLQIATGTFPYNQTNMKRVMRSAYAHITQGVADNSKTKIFSEGDHQGRSGKEAMKQLALPSMMSAYLFNDSTAMSWADFAEYSYFPAVYYMILKSKGTAGAASDRYKGLDLIIYNGGWLGQMIAHSNWESNAASVYMKIGNRIGANHDHADSGSFQIWYKSLLAGDSGYYDKYDSDHHKKYHQATVAHNCIILKNGNTYVGQKQPSETTSFSTWKGDSYKMGTTTGYAYGYLDSAQTIPKYAYLAGDIADAYKVTKYYILTSACLERYDRRMLAVYDTENSAVPLYFFVYDNVTAKDDYKSYQKVFLLHTVTEPSISGKTATVTNGSGKLVLQNVVGNCTLSKVGGSTPNNWKVGGTTYSLISSKSDKTDGYWGRLEVATPSGNKNDIMLNVMYVCDAGSSPSGQSATAITDSSKATGSVIGKVAAVFYDSADRATSSFSFKTNGSGNLNYYVSGVKAGKWTVKVGSTTIGTFTATEAGGLLVFSAPVGTVTLTPQ